jgi:hypothetical protein
VAARWAIGPRQTGRTARKSVAVIREEIQKMKKLFSGKTMYYLLTIATLALLLAENIKWRPDGR